ncbi:hypothetical protein HS088_TW21G00858 [Tripterygium wilfordii]|uniref:Transmembrane protein n=1 Tax=Tripterygium wilfordii TaxID=458696 RepID=A0A7J7C3M9_TRIWF|nr:uncharacterized protein LOC119989894 [Tripterygium wilfordii]XP_038691582.1 uncharacterized protein LOC119989894 [Tripterygium wilfordii]KAF5728708.1 hypothetical protein HS088_TW21G00858 [Tripterygium wilfordii]
MADSQNPNQQHNLPSSSSTSNSSKTTPEISPNTNNNGFSGRKIHYPNPPDAANPDPATLREQWRFAIKQYSKWYAHAWGTAIFAGISFFALGWIIKGGNPLPSFHDNPSAPSSLSDNDKKDDK